MTKQLYRFAAWLKTVWIKVRLTTDGNKASQLFRLIFEGRQARVAIGAAMALVFVANVAVKNSIGGAYGMGTTRPTPSQILLTTEEQAQIVTQKGVQNPLTYLKVNQGFRIYHKGVDLDGDIGDPIIPVASGVVENVIKSRVGYGNHVIVDHGSGFKSLYAHLSVISVVKGQNVDTSNKLGQVGTTGWSTGPHLHLEFWINGEVVNPLQYLQ